MHCSLVADLAVVTSLAVSDLEEMLVDSSLAVGDSEVAKVATVPNVLCDESPSHSLLKHA